MGLAARAGRRGLRLALWHARATLARQQPLPTRLPWGGRWLAWNDMMGRLIWMGDAFESAETAFLTRWVQPGMVVGDCGAHQGYFTLLLSEKVGPTGQVLAFEPSPPQRQRLQRNLQRNGCRNVQVIERALGVRPDRADLFLCDYDSGCNSLRPPAYEPYSHRILVTVDTLDNILAEQPQAGRLDLLKLDAEGAELDILRGAEVTLAKAQPVILIEMQDLRTGPWGYKAADIYLFLEDRGYRWFALRGDGSLSPAPMRETFDDNLVAVPASKLATMDHSCPQ